MRKKTFCKKTVLLFCLLIPLLVSPFAYGAKDAQEFYQIRIYHTKSNEQVQMVDQYLKNAYLPALHRAGIKSIGVFKPITNDTAALKSVYVLIPFTSADAWLKIDKTLAADVSYKTASKGFIEAASINVPYHRIESILLEAFSGQPQLRLPSSKNANRIFELRSYESPTENLYEKKVAMFNTGGEIDIFNRLGFNPVFYGKVLSGSRMPNFIYMPIFESVEHKNAQWKRFSEDAQWKHISTRPEFENKVSVSHIDSILMRSTDYSDI
jgi:hypothetical protein